MKKIIISSLMLALTVPLFSLKSAAQDSDNPLHYGARIGIAGNSLKEYFNEKHSEYRCGLVAGGFASYKVLDILSAQLDVVYAQKGGKDIDSDLLYSDKSPLYTDVYETGTDILLHNLDIVLKANILLPLGDQIKPKIFVGGLYGTTLKAYSINERTYDMGGKMKTTATNDDVTARFAQGDFGLVGGAGVDVDLDMFILSIDVEAKFGLTNMNNVEGNPYFANNSLALVIGIGL